MTAGSQAGIERPGSGATAVLRGVAALRAQVGEWRKAGLTVGLVPTMGGLHAGHLALGRAARSASDRVVVSLFVNPRQFGPAEDLASYPANEASDLRALQAAGVDAAFAPAVAEMYPDGFSTTISVAGLGDVLDGVARPGHFDGVATVVAKLLTQCLPDEAWFGEKDYQQLLIVRRVVCDLDLPVRIMGHPTVRDADGLALSSRNAYLDAAERRIAPALYRAIAHVAQRVAGGAADCGPECDRARQAILAAGFAAVDYVEVRDAATLAPVERVRRPARVLAAARLGKARLIDNVPVA
jgi:pantoate--beta-alanine ligase